MRVFASLLLVCLLTMTGCRQARSISSRLVADVPTRLTGVWTVVASGDSDLRGSLELHSDGRFVAKDLPEDVLDDLDSGSTAPLSGTGRWTYPRDADAKRVILTFLQMQGSSHPVPARAELRVEQEDQAPQLTFHVGDPDEDERVALQLTDAGEGTVR